jgi:hypothetical protein
VKKDNGKTGKNPLEAESAEEVAEGTAGRTVVEYQHPGRALPVRDALTEVLRAWARDLL